MFTLIRRKASPDWAEKLGWSQGDIERLNREAVLLLKEIRARQKDAAQSLISGIVGPRGDGYAVEKKMSAEEAEKYHSVQIRILKESGVDLITCMTINYAEARFQKECVCVLLLEHRRRLGLPVLHQRIGFPVLSV